MNATDLLSAVGGTLLGYYATKAPSFVLFFAGGPNPGKGPAAVNAGVGALVVATHLHAKDAFSQGLLLGSALTTAQGAYTLATGKK